ncbi:MAG: DEAD/DEAH box helicase [Siphonobacter sp.]
MTFDDLNLNTALSKAIHDLGYITPTPIQQKVFPVVMSGKDVCGIAQTGTGKTIAYLLPALRQIQYAKDRLPQVLVLVPTRELVVQVVETVRGLTSYTSLVTVGVFGGVNMKSQIAELKDGLDILVATPGRLIDLVMGGYIKAKSIKKLIIDEMDEMLNLGFRPQLMNILDALPAKRQNLLFSATLTQEVENLINDYFTNPERVEAAPAGTPVANIEQQAYSVPNFYTKVNLLEYLLEHNPGFSKVLVFVSTKTLADELHEQLNTQEKAGVIHSNKAQNHRFNAVQQFHTGEIRTLITTDIIARGLDIAEVSHVINFDIPETPENYIHRIGRTGRADQKGVAISFITEKEQAYQQGIEALMNQAIPMLPLPADLVISTELTEDEKPKISHKLPEIRLPKPEVKGAAFHEKSAKNQKVNVRRNHAEEMMKKYGKPIKKTRRNN